MKKDFIKSAEQIDNNLYLWNDPSYFISSSHRVQNRHTISLFSKTINSSNNIQYSLSTITNNQAFYASTFGNFITIHKIILPSYKTNFNNKYMPNTINSTRTIQKYLSTLRIIRNRCCHSNHVISMKLKNELNNRNLDLLDLTTQLSPFELNLYFIYSRLDNKGNFKRELLRSLKKYESNWIPYCNNHILSQNIISNIDRLFN